MKEYTEAEIQKALSDIEQMEHLEMASIWRFTKGESIYFRSDLPTADAFKQRLFTHFGGFNPEISKQLGW